MKAPAVEARPSGRNRSIATLDLVGGDPCLDFANTLVHRGPRLTGPDLLRSYADLVEWGFTSGLLDRRAAALHRRRATDPSAAAALRRARALREAIHRVFTAVAGRHPAPQPDLDRISRLAGRAQAARRLIRSRDGYVQEWRQTDADAIAGQVADAASRLLTGLLLPRVKRCPGKECGWLFLDTTRNASRRWCSEATCGTRARVERHRARGRGRASV